MNELAFFKDETYGLKELCWNNLTIIFINKAPRKVRKDRYTKLAKNNRAFRLSFVIFRYPVMSLRVFILRP